ncbi:MAG: RNA polymerase sigma factor [Phycisphaeraceae bacterium]
MTNPYSQPQANASDAGRQKALHDAVARYHRPLVAYALSRTGNLQRAQDAAQETLLRLCQQSPEQLKNDILPRLAPWLFTVCRNAVIDLHRKDTRMPPSPEISQDAVATLDPSPSDHAEAHDQQDHLLGLVASLPSHQREVVQLRFQGGLAYKEIADVTGHSTSYVGVLLHDAIAALRQQLTTLNA